jgi:integrase
MKYQFKSFFANDILGYIKLRVSLGNEEDTFARRLKLFDTFCVENYTEKTILSMEIAENWCTKKSNEHTNTLKLRTNILRGFSKYLVSIGKEAYIIPDGFTCKGARFIPYLYNDIELSDFFKSADQLPPHPLSPYRQYVVPVIFRVLYCCGLRPQEVRLLKVSDTNLVEGTFYISDSKRNKDRIVTMSEELCNLCIKYDTLMKDKMPSREYFFQNPNGEPFRIAWIQQQFFRCWKFAGITFTKNHKPRVYDWSHNFATRVIISWMDEQKDVMNRLPYLSTYMGHSSLEYTAYYIHLVPGHLKYSTLTDWNCSQEVPNYED